MSIRNLVSFSSESFIETDSIHRAYLPSGGWITVVDRLTGFGWRDIETGYRSPCGGFWLASGGYDIRDCLDNFNDPEEMAQWVIDRANTCTGYGKRTAYRKVFPECSG
jgi:hypothetical protein